MKLPVFLLSLFLGFAVQAGTAPAVCRAYFEQVQALGWKQVDGVVLDQVLKHIESIPVYVRPKGFNVTQGVRSDAMYFADLHMPGFQWGIFFNYRFWSSKSDEDKALLCTHELLGALGKDDDTYAVTISLKSIVDNKLAADANAGLLSETLKERMGKNGDRPNFYDGKNTYNGGTIVGGGGDFFDLKMKQLALSALLKKQMGSSLEKDGRQTLIKTLLDCDIQARSFKTSTGEQPESALTLNHDLVVQYIQIDRSKISTAEQMKSLVPYYLKNVQILAEIPNPRCK